MQIINRTNFPNGRLRKMVEFVMPEDKFFEATARPSLRIEIALGNFATFGYKAKQIAREKDMETYEQVYSTFEWEKVEAAAMASYTEYRGEYTTTCEIFPYLESCQRRTKDDGYVYPRNATDEEKARIDSQEHYLWEKAGRPGEVNH